MPPILEGTNSYWRTLSGEQIAAGEHRTFVGGLWDELGELQLRFLEDRGLEPHHCLLDVGCGALRGGVRFVDYLAPGNYHGLDLNPSLIEGGRAELERAGLAGKGARLLVDDAFRVGRFGASFDYAIAVSLFTHLHLDQIGRCLKRVGEVLAPGGEFYASFFQAPGPLHLEPLTHRPGGVVTHPDSDPYHQSMRELSFLARCAGLQAELVGDWKHPRAQRMARFFASG